MDGTNVTMIGMVALCCISPDARELLDTVMEEWEKWAARLPETISCNGETHHPRESIYSFAYWLIRYSGLIEPAHKP